MQEPNPFISYLETLRDNRAALAHLRRGLGRPPGTVADMYRYVVPWLTADAPPWREQAYYLVAALFAYHPATGGRGNLGDHFRRLRDPQGEDPAIERRFNALLAAHPDDLDTYLRQAVGFLRSSEIPVNWHQLLADVMAWGHPDKYVQWAWARSYWGRREKN
jgi:CRISPR system Cascade subunit CasB